MQITTVSRSYAKVLFDLAYDAKKLDLVNKDIQALGLLCQKMSKVFVSVDKQASIGTKQDFLNTIIQYGNLNGIIIKFLKLLILENKISLLYDISKSFMELYRKDQNIVVVRVRSIDKMPNQSKEKLSQEISKILKKEIIIDNVVDPAIMGGMVIEIGSYVIDSSLVNNLRRIRLAINEA